MFPGPNAQIYYNEEGEPLGWDYPDNEPPYCDRCGVEHFSECPPDRDDDDDDAPEFDGDIAGESPDPYWYN
jgi:hypothetical protein